MSVTTSLPSGSVQRLPIARDDVGAEDLRGMAVDVATDAAHDLQHRFEGVRTAPERGHLRRDVGVGMAPVVPDQLLVAQRPSVLPRFTAPAGVEGEAVDLAEFARDVKEVHGSAGQCPAVELDEGAGAQDGDGYLAE